MTPTILVIGPQEEVGPANHVTYVLISSICHSYAIKHLKARYDCQKTKDKKLKHLIFYVTRIIP